jgi:hypothetical protein
VENSSPIFFCATSVTFFIKVPKLNNRPIGENSPNLVALLGLRANRRRMWSSQLKPIFRSGGIDNAKNAHELMHLISRATVDFIYPGTGVMIFEKYFRRKIWRKNVRFFVPNTAGLCKLWIITLLYFMKNLAKIAENCDRNIDPRFSMPDTK